MTRLLVTGGRDFDQPLIVFAALLAYHEIQPITVLGHGDAPGLDRLAAEWAELVSVPVCTYPANWPLHGALAGRVRNAKMLRDFRPDVLMSFPGGNGTSHMTSITEAAQIPVVKIVLPRDSLAVAR